jgi:hypothetical protein
LAEAAELIDSERLAADWMLLLDGAVTSAQVSSHAFSFQQAKAVATNLLETDIDLPT